MKNKHEFFKVFEIKWYSTPYLSWGKHWEPREPIGNLKGTRWEQRKNEKNPPSPPPPQNPNPNPKRKKNKAH
jgi:hypothetical protein